MQRGSGAEQVKTIGENSFPQLPESLVAQFLETRNTSLKIAEPLSEADCQIQSMPDASPTKWHLAHTSWFFETFILKKFVQSYQPYDVHFAELYNSYYNKIGAQFSRPDRGLLSRPSLAEIVQYRQFIDTELSNFVQSEKCTKTALELLEIGIQHEKQHQELMLTDILHGLSLNPMLPAYKALPQQPQVAAADLHWIDFAEGVQEVGATTESFSFDNERPRHKQYVQAFRLASRTVTNAEYRQFVEDKGYQRSEFWLADGWNWVQENRVEAPLYWRNSPDLEMRWFQFGLAGLQPLEDHLPVCHLNFYEASAYASWAGKRLPTEFEWEVAAQKNADQGNYLNLDYLQPVVATDTRLVQMMGNVWEWTNSSYLPYPGFEAFAGDAGEYNGKFMSGQFVLRGGSCVSPQQHVRSTYRNFFYPHQSWQFSGVRLAEDME